MTTSGWKDAILLAAKGDEETMNILVDILSGMEKAEQMLKDAGIGCSVLSAIECFVETTGESK